MCRKGWLSSTRKREPQVPAQSHHPAHPREQVLAATAPWPISAFQLQPRSPPGPPAPLWLRTPPTGLEPWQVWTLSSSGRGLRREVCSSLTLQLVCLCLKAMKISLGLRDVTSTEGTCTTQNTSVQLNALTSQTRRPHQLSGPVVRPAFLQATGFENTLISFINFSFSTVSSKVWSCVTLSE